TSTGSAAVGGIIAQALLTATTTASLKMTDNYVSTSISGGASDTNNSVSAVYVGGIGGFIQINAPTIADIDFNNCVVENSKISGYATNGCVAGLIGALNAQSQTSLNIKNCDVLASDIWLTTNNMAFVGGLVGWANRSSGVESNISIEKCDVLDGSITSSALATYTGGLIGADYSTSTVIDLCRISASIYASSSTNVAFIGGILGDSSAALTITRSEITSDEITGKATKKCYTGGIAGYASDITAKTCFVKCRTISATSSADNSTAGGLVGQSNTTNISACSVEAEVQASTVSEKTSYAGGLIGYGKLNIKGCLFEGTVAGSVAGLIAGQATEITKASNILCRTSSELTTLVGSSSDGLSPINVIVETDSGNYYIDGGDGFAKWGIVEGKPLPAELFWIASGASVCTIDWLTENGYNGL
ncbi:MAG: hypothetical protein IJX25_04340, partial [Clostridia bacterium]|nr:hypothetical protein [Clostridia bacterium]